MQITPEEYNNPQGLDENLVGLRMTHTTLFVNLEDKEIPANPLDAAVWNWKKVCTNPVDKKVEEELGKNAVKTNISILPDKLKLLLPYLAYYMVTPLMICP